MEKVKKANFFTAKNISYLGVLAALVIVLQLWASMIPIGASGLNLSFVLLPITLGGILLGPLAGAFLGLVFGLVVLFSGIAGWSFFTYTVFTYSPVVTTLICIVKGVLCGLAGGAVYKLISKKNKYVAVFAASAAVPVVNTGTFIIGCLFMKGTLVNFAADYLSLSSDNIMYIIIVGLVSVNFFIEFAINLICSPALHTVTRIVEKQIVKNNGKTTINNKED